MRKYTFPITTDGSGNATVISSAVLLGELETIAYYPGTIATGATITVTAEGDASHTLLVKASAGTTNTWYHPRELIHNPADGAALTGTQGGDREEPIVDGYLKVVVASGGAGGIGSVVVYVE